MVESNIKLRSILVVRCSNIMEERREWQNNNGGLQPIRVYKPPLYSYRVITKALPLSLRRFRCGLFWGLLLVVFRFANNDVSSGRLCVKMKPRLVFA